MSAMQTGKAKGNTLLNEELLRLVTQHIIDKEEALSKAVDKLDLAKKLGSRHTQRMNRRRSRPGQRWSGL